MCELLRVRGNYDEDIILYGKDANAARCDLLIIAIDDDDVESFSSHIPYILNIQQLDDIIYHLLHLKSFIDGKNIVNSLFNWQTLNSYSFIKDASKKIYLIDLYDRKNATKYASEIIALVSKLGQEFIVMSMQGKEINYSPNYTQYKKLLKQDKDTMYAFTDKLNNYLTDTFSEIIPDKLADLSSNDWHRMRVGGTNRNDTIGNIHHWLYGGSSQINWKECDVANLWELLPQIEISAEQNLQNCLSDSGYKNDYKNMMFQSSTSKPAIRELLQTDSLGKDLTNYIRRIEANLKCLHRDINISITINGNIKKIYCWFNVCALYRALHCIIKGYADEIRKMKEKRINVSNPSIQINIMEMNNDPKGLMVQILETPLQVALVSWPISSSMGSVTPHTKKLLQYIQNQSVDEISYHANEYNGAAEKSHKVNIKKALDNNGDCKESIATTNNFTFKWVIPAYEVACPYSGQTIWTCKYDGDKVE